MTNSRLNTRSKNKYHEREVPKSIRRVSQSQSYWKIPTNDKINAFSSKVDESFQLTLDHCFQRFPDICYNGQNAIELIATNWVPPLRNDQ